VATLVQHVRDLACRDTVAAERACGEAVAQYPLAGELHYLHALLLMELGRDQEALPTLRRVLYLDRSLAVAHFTLGALLWRCGDVDGARCAYRNAAELSKRCPPDVIVPLSDGEQAGRLADAAAYQLAILDAARGVAP
jgi:chemotaxis protein methyltransferase CheR